MMANYMQVALLLGIFLPSNLAQFNQYICADSLAQAEAQCASIGGDCLGVGAPGCDNWVGWVSRLVQ